MDRDADEYQEYPEIQYPQHLTEPMGCFTIPVMIAERVLGVWTAGREMWARAMEQVKRFVGWMIGY